MSDRKFEDVINEWTAACVEENRGADLASITIVTRLGLLGQRLIYEANQIGMNDIVRMSREVNNAAGTN